MVRTVTVTVKGDLLAEGPESFKVVLGTPTLATLARAIAIGTILDNEP